MLSLLFFSCSLFDATTFIKKEVKAAYQSAGCCDSECDPFPIQESVQVNKTSYFSYCKPRSAFWVGNSYTYWDNIWWPAVFDELSDESAGFRGFVGTNGGA